MSFKIGVICLSVFVSCVVGRAVDKRSGGEGTQQWGYTEENGVLGPKSWYKTYKFCAGKSQSPINIENPMKIQVKSSLHLGGYKDVVGSITNNGHSATFNVDKSQGTLTILKGRFKLEQLHFHFGCTNDVGSEHTVNGKPYPAEVHLVFFNTKYETIQQAQAKKGGLLVLGAFLEMNDYNMKLEYSELDKIITQLQDIKQPGSVIPIDEPIDLTNLVPPLKDDDDVTVYMYPGSLTTPPCYESVKWMILNEPIPVSSYQLEVFRTLNSDHGSMCDNYRPVQSGNGRMVFEVEF